MMHKRVPGNHKVETSAFGGTSLAVFRRTQIGHWRNVHTTALSRTMGVIVGCRCRDRGRSFSPRTLKSSSSVMKTPHCLFVSVLPLAMSACSTVEKHHVTYLSST